VNDTRRAGAAVKLSAKTLSELDAALSRLPVQPLPGLAAGGRTSQVGSEAATAQAQKKRPVSSTGWFINERERRYFDAAEAAGARRRRWSFDARASRHHVNCRRPSSHEHRRAHANRMKPRHFPHDQLIP
jgi:hypothetical protein